MAYTERFKQIEPFVGKMQRAPHAAHLSWMQRFQERVQTLIVTELGEDCPAMITSQNTALVAAVQAEDEAYRTINQDEDYYVQHVFPKAKLKKVKITDAVSFYFATNETWKKAAEQHPDENAGRTVTEADELLYQTQRLLDAQGNAVDATKKVDDTKQYQLEQPAPDSEVTPVVPEA